MTEQQFRRDYQSATAGVGELGPQSETVHADGRVWYVDDDGTPWSVHERVTGGRRAGPAVLVFDRPGAFRRVTRYPADWASLSRAELVALCEQT